MVENHEKKDVDEKMKELQDCKIFTQPFLKYKPITELYDELKHKNLELGPRKKIIHFVRHGEGYHNKAQREWRAKQDYDGSSSPYSFDIDQEFKFLDPKLTEVGTKQAEELEKITKLLKVDIIITSPLQRAIQTAEIGFSSQIKNKVKFIAEELCHEIGGFHTCDKRLSVTELKSAYPKVEFSGIETEDDPLWLDGYTRESAKDISIRSAKFINFLQERPETRIVVTSHSTILLAIFNASLLLENYSDRQWFGTGEMRSVVIDYQ